MGARPVQLPRARVEVRGLPGHVAQVSAHARVGARVLGRIGLTAARVLGALALFVASVGMIAALAPPPRLDQQIERLRHIQIDVRQLEIERAQVQSEQLRAWVEANQDAVRRDLLAPHLQVVPVAPADGRTDAPGPGGDRGGARPPAP